MLACTSRMVSFLSCILVLFGTAVSFALSGPIIRQLQARKQELEEQIEER